MKDCGSDPQQSSLSSLPLLPQLGFLRTHFVSIIEQCCQIQRRRSQRWQLQPEPRTNHPSRQQNGKHRTKPSSLHILTTLSYSIYLHQPHDLHDTSSGIFFPKVHKERSARLELTKRQDRGRDRHDSLRFLPVLRAMEHVAGMRFLNQLPFLGCRVCIDCDDTLLLVLGEQDGRKENAICCKHCLDIRTGD
jgi:hypothetical protein